MAEIKCISFGNWPTIVPRKQKKNVRTYIECTLKITMREGLFFFRFKFCQQRCMDNNGVVGLTWWKKSVVVWTCTEHILNRNAFRHWNQIKVIDNYAKWSRSNSTIFWHVAIQIHLPTIHSHRCFFRSFCSPLAALYFRNSMNLPASENYADEKNFIRRNYVSWNMWSNFSYSIFYFTFHWYFWPFHLVPSSQTCASALTIRFWIALPLRMKCLPLCPHDTLSVNLVYGVKRNGFSNLNGFCLEKRVKTFYENEIRHRSGVLKAFE